MMSAKAFNLLIVALLTCASSVASAGIFDCAKALTDMFSSSSEQTPIIEQRIAKKNKTDQELARAWVWREHEKNKQTSIGFNIAPQAVTDFIVSIPSWKTLMNGELRSLLRVFEAVQAKELLGEESGISLSSLLDDVGATPADLEMWRIHLPGLPLR